MFTSNLERSLIGTFSSKKYYHIFLDESNNIGKLKHTPNTNRTFNQVISKDNIFPPIFILGGIAKHSNQELSCPDWKIKLNLQNDELKFSKIGNNFFNRLGSRELKEVLTWIRDNNCFIHFALYDWIYFYNVDIIDSFIANDDNILKYLHKNKTYSVVNSQLKWYKKNNHLNTNNDITTYLYLLKDLLNEFIKNNLSWFLGEIHNNHYKKVDENQQPIFLENLYQQLKSINDKKYYVLVDFLEIVDKKRI